MHAAGSTQALRFAAAHSDGETLTCYRWSSDAKPPTLYWRAEDAGVIVVSEPVDARRADWHPIASNHVLLARAGQQVEVRPFEVEAPLLAA
jgi:glutamine amidotransferase